MITNPVDLAQSNELAPNTDIAKSINDTINGKSKFQRNVIPPHYYLHKDTIKSFFYEKKEQLESSSKALGWMGIFLSTLTALLTSTFNDFWGIKSKYIETAFIGVTLVSFAYACKYGYWYWKYRKDLEVNSLTDELGKRSTASVINEE